MTILIYCLFIAFLLPYLAKGPVAYAMNKLGGYDNLHPREQQSRLTGFGARALAAHQNAFESLILFGPAIVLAIATNNASDTVVTLAITHVIARIGYTICYYANLGVLRSTMWLVAIVCSFAIVWQCIPA